MSQPYAPPRDPTAVLGRRFVAFAIDLFFLLVVGLILLATAKHNSFYDAPSDACSQIARSDSSVCWQITDRLYIWERGVFTRALLIGGFVGFLDLVVLQTLTGASIGKLCVGLRVVEVQGNEARFLRVLGRWLFLAIDLGFLLVGVVSTLVTRPHRRIGDLVCGTYVVGVASVGRPVVVPTAPGPVPSPSAYGAPAGAPAPPGWGAPAGFPSIPASVPVATPPGTGPTTPGEWGAVARPAPVVRAPKWEAPPPSDDAVPVARDTMAPQWATPPGPKDDDADPSEQHAAAEPMPAPEAAPEPLAQAPRWSPIVPLADDDEPAAESSTVQPPPLGPPPWRPIVPLNGDPTPSPEPPPTPPAPPPPTEPSPPPPTEPPPPAPTADTPVEAEPVAEPEPEDDVPWWDAEPSGR
jgi:uncharacterized RDD family membrane protein YckC